MSVSNQVFSLHDIPDLRIFDFDFFEANDTLVYFAFDFTLVFSGIAQLNLFQLLSESGDSLEDNVDQLHIEASC